MFSITRTTLLLLFILKFSCLANATCEEDAAENTKMLEQACSNIGTPICSYSSSFISGADVPPNAGGPFDSEKIFIRCQWTVCDNHGGGTPVWYTGISRCVNGKEEAPVGPPSEPCEGACCSLASSSGAGVAGAAGAGSGAGSAGGPPGPLKEQGSVVFIEPQTLQETVPLVGSNFSLSYYSGYQKGRIADFQVKYRISGEVPRDHITGFSVALKRGGTIVDTATYSNTLPNQKYIYTWNGLDPSNTVPSDSAQFQLVVTETSPSGSFAIPYTYLLSHWDAKKLGLGGWLPNSLLHYDGISGRLYFASGEYRKVQARNYGSSQLYVASENGSRVYIFDANGNHLFTKTGLLGTTILSFSYDSSGRLISISEPFNKVTLFNRNSGGDLTSITAANGQTTVIGLDLNGYISNVVNTNSENYSFTYYGSNGMLRSFQKPNGELNEFEYTTDGLITKNAHSGGYFFELIKELNLNVNYDVTIKTSMDRTKNVKTVVKNNGDSSQAVRDISGSTQTSNFLVSGTSYVREYYDGAYNSQVLSSNDFRFGNMSKSATRYSVTPNGGGSVRTTTFSNMVTLQDPQDPFSILSWSRVAHLSGTDRTETTTFDPLTKELTTTTNLGKTFVVGLDAYERLTSFKVGDLDKVTLSYSDEKLTSIIQNGRTFSASYNAIGLLQSTTNQLGQTIGYIYNSANRIISKVLPDSRVISFGYDAIGNLLSIKPPERPIHTFSVNNQGLVSGYQPPELNGVSVVNTTYSYNQDKQLTRISRPDGKYLDFNYNNTTGVIENISTNTGVHSYSINTAIGLPTYVATPDGVSMYLGYVGREVSAISTFVNGVAAGKYAVTYGTHNRVISDVVVGGGSGPVSSILYSYNNDEDLVNVGDIVLNYNVPNGQLASTTMGVGAAEFSDLYTYNSYGEVTGYQAKYGSNTIYEMSLTRDALGRVSGKSETIESKTNAVEYSYDSSGRLIEVSRNAVPFTTYTYDGNSNRIGGMVGLQPVTATYDDQDRLLTYNTLSYTYNANGDLTSKTNNTISQTTSYTYDVFGNLREVVLPMAKIITYDIDGLNRRIAKRVNGVVERRWVYMDQYRIAAELDSAGNITKRFVYGSKKNIPDYMIMGGVNYRIISDHLGSPRLVVRQTDGKIMQRIDYDPFGRVTRDTNTCFQPFGFAGGLYDNLTGLVRFGARDYDPEIGRWTSKDPILFGGGDTNLFGYVQNDPVNWIDPEGMTKKNPGQVLENDPFAGGGGGSVGSSANVAITIKPNGQMIGQAGSSSRIRVMPGGMQDAQNMYGGLCKGGTPSTPSNYPGQMVKFSDGGTVGFRPSSSSGPPTIDINIPGMSGIKIKFTGD